MFTGLIEAIGRIESVEAGSQGMRIGVFCPPIASELAIGDSINIDGACQTVVATSPSSLSVEAVGDTLVKTTFRGFKRGTKVNLERALRADGRFGGHIVTGHVTGTGRILSWGPHPAQAGFEVGAWFLTLNLESSWEDRVAPEGSIAVDGISLTIAALDREPKGSGSAGLRARISVIPHTRQATTLPLKKQGDLVNIELDILASYARAAVKAAVASAPGLSLEKLASWGYS
ncbi:MAG TPA: riboflavin synthase [Spirochaetia bacterium]|nr:riboflavin synthase [Spirochaetia bacterium]